MTTIENLASRASWIPLFNPRKIGEKWLLTNRLGDWLVLSAEEYQTLTRVFTPQPLINKLADNRLAITKDGPSHTDLLDRWQRYNTGFYTGPYLHIVHLTQRCNLGCSYCHSAAIPVESKGRDLTPERADAISEFIIKTPNDRINVNFQGGEPTLMPDLIRRIMERLLNHPNRMNRRISASITTNGTLIDEKLLKLFKEFNISTTVSIDGPKEIHDTIRIYRDGSGSFEDALHGRSLLIKELGGNASGAILVLTNKSITNIREIIEEYSRLGQTSIHLKPVTKLGKGKSNWNDLAIEFEDFWGSYTQAIEFMIALQEKEIYITELSLILALRKILEGRDTTYVDFRNPCGLVYGVLNYDIDGKIYACHEGKRKKEFLLGSTDAHPDEILWTEKAQNISSSSVLDQHAACRSCSYIAYCAPCPAHNAQVYGSMEVRPHEDWHCRFTIALNDYLFKKLTTDPEPLLRWWRFHIIRDTLLQD